MFVNQFRGRTSLDGGNKRVSKLKPLKEIKRSKKSLILGLDFVKEPFLKKYFVSREKLNQHKNLNVDKRTRINLQFRCLTW